MVFRISIKKTFYIFDMKAIHNKDYSVVKTFSASPTCGAFFLNVSFGKAIPFLMHSNFRNEVSMKHQ